MNTTSTKISVLCRIAAAAMCASLLFCSTIGLTCAQTASSASYQLDIPSQDLHTALQAFAVASHHRLLYRSSLVAGKSSPELKGTFTTEEAVRKLLTGTDLTYEITGASVVLIRRANSGPATSDNRKLEPSNTRSADASSSPTAHLVRTDQTMQKVDGSETSESRGGENAADRYPVVSDGIPEILVKGSKVLNMDIRRTRDDVQPTVIFGRERIRNSGATNLNDFFKQRLPMNTTMLNDAQNTATFASRRGPRSAINLRGLGTDETLILIDGR